MEESIAQSVASLIPTILISVLVIGLILTILVKGYVNAKPNEVIIITGLRKQRHFRGKAGFMIPFVERRSYLDIEQFSTDVRTSEAVPTLDFINVRADAAVKLKIGTTDEMIARAAENFLNWNTKDISNSVQDVLEGNLREVIGQMELRKMVNDRQEFASKVQDNVAPDLAKMGLEVIAFTVQSFSDEGGVIDNLGIENVETIKKDASIAKAKAERERKEVEAEQNKLANDARVEAELEIAKRNTDLAKQQAALKVESDTERAKAEAAYNIQEQIQRKSIEIETASAEIARQEQEAIVKEREVAVKRQTLAASVEAEADAQKYAAERNAEADLIRRQKAAEAELFETQKEAEAQERRAEANRRQAEEEAKGIEAKGRAEAEAIRMKLDAEAEGLDKKAEAMKKYGEAAITEMLVNVLPEIAKNVAAPLANVDKITMYGEGNSGKMVGDIMTSMNQITNGMGLNVQELITATLTGRAMGRAQAEAIEVPVEEPTSDDEPFI